MRNPFWRLQFDRCALWIALKDESGWELAEYGAAIAIVLLGLTAGVHTFASGVNSAMTYFAGQIGNMSSVSSRINGQR